MDKVNLTTHSEEETMAFGEWIGAHAVNDLFIALNGDLGTGKTHFVQGLAKGMGINDAVGSPTFMIMNYYEGVLPLKHFDFIGWVTKKIYIISDGRSTAAVV